MKLLLAEILSLRINQAKEKRMGIRGNDTERARLNGKIEAYKEVYKFLEIDD